MIPVDREELDIVAGEYVAGVLDAEAAREVETALAGNGELREMVAAWERRLHPLTRLADEAEPPPDLWERIAVRLDAGAAPASHSAQKTLALWRWSTVAAAAVAAALALYIALAPPKAGPSLVAVMHPPQGDELVWVATASGDGLRLRPVAAASPPPDRAFELWAIAPNSKPQSLGVVPTQGRFDLAVDPSVVRSGTTLALSVEPKTGSPTGQPTGAVVFIGTLVAAD
ncbi:MAG TPA: anti-sigma factor [Stellaceae bacterium]|nr:anti-sigma factor [Stellaceae bacterium]